MRPRMACALLALLTVAPVPAVSAAPSAQRVDGGKTPVYAPIAARVSANGRYVVFVAHAQPTAAENDRTFATHVYLFDRVAKTRELISVHPDGSPNIGVATSPQVSADGRYVVFSSEDANLVPGDTNRVSDVFLRDRRRHLTTRISVDYRGRQLAPPIGLAAGELPSISPDGRIVVFYSAGFVTHDDRRFYQASGYGVGLYLRDLRTGRVDAVARTLATGDPAQRFTIIGAAPAPVSADDRYVTFGWEAPERRLTGDPHESGSCVYRRDIVRRRTLLVACAGTLGGYVGTVTASANAARVAFTTMTLNAGPFGRGTSDLWVADVPGGTAHLVDGRPVGGDEVGEPALSADGKVLAFVRNPADAVQAGAVDETSDPHGYQGRHVRAPSAVFVWHVGKDVVATPAQPCIAGQPCPVAASFAPSLSSDGSVLVLVTGAPLAADDADLPGGERVPAADPGAANTAASANADDVYALVA